MKSKINYPVLILALNLSFGAMFLQQAAAQYKTNQPPADVNTNVESAMPYLISFNGVYNSGNVYLKWLVQGQTTDCIYLIERSADGENFNIFDTKNGIGTAPEPVIMYCYTDTLPAYGASYYRLKRITPEWKVSVSQSVKVEVFDIDEKVREMTFGATH